MRLIPFDFESKTVRVLTDDHGEPLFVAKDVAEALGYKDPTTAVKTHCRGVQELHPIVDSLGRTQEARVIREPDLYRLIAGSTLPSAVAFERKVFEEILPTIRKTGSYNASHQPDPFENALPYLPTVELQIAEAAARMLRMSETSKIRMLTNLCEIKGVSSDFLPAYVDEDLTKALTVLLKEHGSALSAKTANLALMDLGLLEEMERTGGKGEIKRFKSLTASGLRYGRNETSPQNPRETQPLYFVRTFPGLLDLIETHLHRDEAA